MRILAAAAVLALLTMPAYSQGMNLLGPETKDVVKEQKREEQERAYRAATQKIPDQKPTVNDPWGNVRGTAEVKSDPKAKVRTNMR